MKGDASTPPASGQWQKMNKVKGPNQDEVRVGKPQSEADQVSSVFPQCSLNVP
jgi:hypothetical protein